MTEAEFRKLLETAREKRQAWKEAVAKNELRSDEHLNFLNIMSRHSKNSSIDTATSQASVGSRSSSVASSVPAPLAGSNTRVKVGPTYGFFEPLTPTIVQGRTLGRIRSNQVVVGVCGVVASLPSYSSPHLQNTSKSLQPYFVYRAELDADGRPNVVLGHTAPGPGNWLSGSIGGRHGDLYYGPNRLPQGAASTTSTTKGPLEGDAGRKVVSRVQGLLEARDKYPTRS